MHSNDFDIIPRTVNYSAKLQIVNIHKMPKIFSAICWVFEIFI